MGGYPQIPWQTKRTLFPYLVLVAVAWVALQGLGGTTPAAGSSSSTRVPKGLSFTSAHGCQPRADWRSRRLDPQVRTLLVRVAKHHRVRVSCLRTGHSTYVRGTRRVSNHTVWRAVDIDMVDGRPVRARTRAAYALAVAIGRGRYGVQPSEVGSPWSFGRRPWFTDRGHQGHLHIGFRAAAAPSRAASALIPSRYLALYRKAGAGETWKARDGRRYAAWAVLAGVGKVESNHCRARGAKPGGSSSAGALGCMQFMPGTWPGYGRGSVYDPANSIPAAGRYLRAHGARRNLAWALAAYNAGPGRASNPPAVTRRYVINVRALARRYQKGA